MNIYPLIVFLDHTMKVDKILGTNPLPVVANLFIESLVDNVPDSGDNLGIEELAEYHLHRVYPNPFNPILNIEFQLEKSDLSKVEVYDLQGNQVDVLYNGFLKSGHYKFSWDAEEHPSGTYFVSLISSESKVTTSAVLLK